MDTGQRLENKKRKKLKPYLKTPLLVENVH